MKRSRHFVKLDELLVRVLDTLYEEDPADAAVVCAGAMMVFWSQTTPASRKSILDALTKIMKDGHAAGLKKAVTPRRAP